MLLTGSLDYQTTPALKLRGGALKPVSDDLVVEGVLQIRVAGEPYSVTMRTPGDDENLALGLLFAEGVISGMDAVVSCEAGALRSALGSALGPEAALCGEVGIDSDGGADGCVDIILRSDSAAAVPHGRRRLASNASCGACGKVSADDLMAVQSLGERETSAVSVTSMLPWLETQMKEAQSLFRRTGGSHAAAIFDADGGLLALKEDVGRHNAVDKAVGQLLRDGRLDEASMLLISGRVSYEIVAKAAKAGIRVLLAVSAPSSLAVKLCDEAGIALLGFCRGGDATIYTHAEKLGVAA